MYWDWASVGKIYGRSLRECKPCSPSHLQTSGQSQSGVGEGETVGEGKRSKLLHAASLTTWLQMTVTGVMSCSSIQDIAEKAPFTRPNRCCNKESAHCVHFTSLCGDPTDLTLLSKYSYYLNFRWWSRSALSVSHIWHHRSYLSSPCRGGSDSLTLITRGLIARVNAPLNGRCLWAAEDSVVIRALGLDYSVWSNRCLWVRNIFQFISSLLQFTFNFV